jgi:hypothetical protein
LDAFGLVNMNARLYDPKLGRLLSVDNYVSDPTSDLLITALFNCYFIVRGQGKEEGPYHFRKLDNPGRLYFNVSTGELW